MKMSIGFLMGVLFISFSSWIISGPTKESLSYAHALNFAQPELVTVVIKNGVQFSHQRTLEEIINPTVRERMMNYDTVYVTCLPRRTEIEAQTDYTVTSSVIYFFHAFSPKRYYNGENKKINFNPQIIYDPQGDLKYIYCASHR